MRIQKAFKFELMPNGAQSHKIRQFCGCARFVFNKALAWQNEQYQADNRFKFSYYSKIANNIPLWKQESLWLKDSHSQVLQQSLKTKIAKLHHHIANSRKDSLHKISTHISQNHAIVYVEDLQVKNMSKSAKGTAEKHGKNVKQKSGLNRAILDQGWHEFRRQLEYKLTWQGGQLIAVPPQNTSRRCLACAHTDKANRQAQERFKCVACGFAENADVVGAINVLHKGQDLMKQSGQDMPVALVK